MFEVSWVCSMNRSFAPRMWFADAVTSHTAKTPRAGRRVGVEGEG